MKKEPEQARWTWDAWTHLPPLLREIARASRGKEEPVAVVECGGGLYSTPVLRELVEGLGGFVVTLESNKEWCDFLKRKYPDTDTHKVMHVCDWTHGSIRGALGDRWFDVALVDHCADADGGKYGRTLTALHLISHADTIVVHDVGKRAHKTPTDPYAELFQAFEHWEVYKEAGESWTLILKDPK
jgi:hypothetical protein